jgi:hypothetical protein
MAFKCNNNQPEDELIISYQAPLEPCPEGRHPIICVDVFKVDPEEATYDGVTKLYEKVMFVFQAFPESGERDSEGKPFQVERKFTWSLAPEGHLRPFLESWRGREKEELKSFDLKTVKGAQAFGVIVHNTRWVNIEAIEPYKDDDGQNLPPLQAGAYTRRNYKKKDKAQTVTAQAQPASSSQATPDLVLF